MILIDINPSGYQQTQNTFEYPVIKATFTLIVFRYSQFVEVLMSIYLTRKPLDQNLDIHFKVVLWLGSAQL